jgi:uncharacterized membrane protein
LIKVLPSMETYQLIRFIVATVLAGALAAHGYKKKSLNVSGSLAAIVVGFVSFAASYRLGWILILFYYTSSKLTKVKESVKAKLEDGYAQGGQRNAIQVFANSILATIVAIVFYIYCGEDTYNISFKPSSVKDNTGAHEVVSFLGVYSIEKGVLASYLLALYIAHYACATADTWASELGILSKSQPRLVTSLFLKSVPSYRAQ